MSARVERGAGLQEAPMSTRTEHAPAAAHPQDALTAAHPEPALLPESLTLNGRVLDRRAFLGCLAAAGAGLCLSGVSRGAGAAPLEDSSAMTLANAIPQGGGHVDDMWGHWPRYAHPIPYTLVRHVPISLDGVPAADRVFIA
jgi:hypothetical protein